MSAGINHDPAASRYAADLENALLARALFEAGGLTDERGSAVLRQWAIGSFNAAAHGVPLLKDGGVLRWEREGSGLRLVWIMPGGIICPLARLYPQEDGTWAALVVAGVKDDPADAMIAAEWAVSRLTGG
jgi:hypothetical protein